jgi:hypothetical protein
MDGYLTATTGTVGNTLSFSNFNTNTTAGLLEIIGGISTMPMPLISFGDIQLTGGHLTIGLITYLLLYVGYRLDREYSQFLTLESLEEKEQELHNL